MLPRLSTEELTAIRRQLENEQKLIEQFTICARTAGDPQLRTAFEQISARHHLHWETLVKLLGMDGGV